MKRSFLTTIAVAATCIGLTACGGGSSVLGIGKPTINLNSEESTKQLEPLMGGDCKPSDLPDSATDEEKDNALKDYFRCIGDQIDGTTLTMTGVALEVMGEVPFIEKKIPDFVMLTVGNSNSLLMRTFKLPGGEEPLAPYSFSFACPRSVSSCNDVQKGDKVELTAEFDTEVSYLPTEGMPVAAVTNLTIN